MSACMRACCLYTNIKHAVNMHTFTYIYKLCSSAICRVGFFIPIQHFVTTHYI